MPSLKELRAAAYEVFDAGDQLLIEIDRLRKAQTNAKIADIDFLNPQALELLALHVAELTELTKVKSIDFATSKKFKAIMTGIESSAGAMTVSQVRRTI